MALLMTENRPQSCSEVGLNCRDCVAESARQVAEVCRGLRGGMIGQLFVQIYADPACAPMHGHFAACYREASGEGMRKGPLRAVAAAAGAAVAAVA
jgi:hypothetical protein